MIPKGFRANVQRIHCALEISGETVYTACVQVLCALIRPIKNGRIQNNNNHNGTHAYSIISVRSETGWEHSHV